MFDTNRYSDAETVMVPLDLLEKCYYDTVDKEDLFELIKDHYTTHP